MLLIQNIAGYELHEPTQYYYPAPFFFYGKYDDYGAAYDCHGSQLPYLLGEFQETGVGNGSEWTIDQLFEADHENKLRLTTAKTFYRQLAGERDPHIPVTHVVILQDVFDELLEKYSWDVWMPELRTANYQTYLDYIPATISSLKQFYNKDITIRFLQWPADHNTDLNDNILSREITNHFGRPRDYFFIESLSDRIEEYVLAEEDDKLEEMLIEFSKMCVLHAYMRGARKTFFPANSAGQDVSTEGQRLMAEITIKAGKAIDARFDE